MREGENIDQYAYIRIRNGTFLKIKKYNNITVNTKDFKKLSLLSRVTFSRAHVKKDARYLHFKTSLRTHIETNREVEQFKDNFNTKV